MRAWGALSSRLDRQGATVGSDDVAVLLGNGDVAGMSLGRADCKDKTQLLWRVFLIAVFTPNYSSRPEYFGTRL